MSGNPKWIDAEDVKRGMLLDLENDTYADPTNDDESYKYEFAIVESVERGQDLTTIEFRSGETIVFPNDHQLNWTGDYAYRQGE